MSFEVNSTSKSSVVESFSFMRSRLSLLFEQPTCSQQGQDLSVLHILSLYPYFALHPLRTCSQQGQNALEYGNL
jgi:hypothetical protein